jgi:hypothetical protein
MQIIDKIARGVRYRLRTTNLRAPLVWIRHRRLHPQDVFLASYQRSGSTWIRFLLCELLTGSPADHRNVKLSLPDVRHHRKGRLLLGNGRLIKTHEPYRSEYKKAIYIVRDPRDVAISLYEYDTTERNLDDFISTFVAGKATPHGTWRHNVESWLCSPLHASGSLLVVKYESMHDDTEKTLSEILRFLNLPLNPDAIRTAITSNGLQRMRAKEDVARAKGVEVSGERIRTKARGVRKGSVGEWRERLTDAQAKLIEEHAGDLLAELGYDNSHLSVLTSMANSELEAMDSIPAIDEATA